MLRKSPASTSKTGSGSFLGVLLVLALVVGAIYVLKQRAALSPSPSRSSGSGPVTLGEGEFEFMTGPDGAPKVDHCDPRRIYDTSDKKCDDVKIVIIDAALMPWVARNISLAWNERYPAVLHKGDEAGYQARRAQACGTRYVSTYVGGSCDEYPFASSAEGGTDSIGRQARTEEVPKSEQDCQGGTIRQAYRRQNIQEGDQYIVIITHPDRVATTAWTGQPRSAISC